MDNIQTNGNVTLISPLQDDSVSKESIDNCIKIARLNALNKKLFNNCSNVSCSICNKCQSKSIANGSFNASIMLVDAFPSEYESFTGCFTDKKGYLLEECLKDCKTKRSDIYCTTLIKCTNIKDTNQSIIQNCLKHYFLEELKLIHPSKFILTYSAFQACLKYQIIPYIGSINYFTKFNVTVNNSFNVDMYVIYDLNNITEQSRVALKQGLNYILQ